MKRQALTTRLSSRPPTDLSDDELESTAQAVLAGDPVAKNVAKEQARKIGISEAMIKKLYADD